LQQENRLGKQFTTTGKASTASSIGAEGAYRFVDPQNRGCTLPKS